MIVVEILLGYHINKNNTYRKQEHALSVVNKDIEVKNVPYQLNKQIGPYYLNLEIKEAIGLVGITTIKSQAISQDMVAITNHIGGITSTTLLVVVKDPTQNIARALHLAMTVMHLPSLVQPQVHQNKKLNQVINHQENQANQKTE